MTSVRKLIDNNTRCFVNECSGLIDGLFKGHASYDHRAKEADLMIDSIKDFMSKLEITILVWQKNINNKSFEDTAIDLESTNSSSECEASPPKKNPLLSPHEELKHKMENIMEFYSSIKQRIFLSGNLIYAKRLMGNLKYLKMEMENLIVIIQIRMEKEEKTFANAAAGKGHSSRNES
ncbi:uncharacterized protein LOC129575960 [Sitodiplosis mosellana]|uniref:uncharacterized protein LOC129575960 n=1 Tax=Sitodiplosis mosellana TaxID=263140 RepID=UPI002444182C|nr:uncharacterized protein LOC129575960 [Sitodiplosis mosellana]